MALVRCGGNGCGLQPLLKICSFQWKWMGGWNKSLKADGEELPAVADALPPTAVTLSATITRITRTPSSNGLPAWVFLWIEGDFPPGQAAGLKIGPPAGSTERIHYDPLL
ncbi:hypothetical protein [Paenibacillus eucommiae]|uniref:Uncharacterized protein n=1 Tax=Paenibacillus eucommiae TaxID=1355755 RepID=A0ABS4J183_9BACL|nr:hypothetical protein [Paenibacillus eucommiae]MBP1993555.1 hypothetical protein [Paenibacillus eucommiae]